METGRDRWKSGIIRRFFSALGPGVITGSDTTMIHQMCDPTQSTEGAFLYRRDQWVLAPFLRVGILVVACDGTLMQGQPSSWLSRIIVGTTVLVMFGAAAAMFAL